MVLSNRYSTLVFSFILAVFLSNISLAQGENSSEIKRQPLYSSELPDLPGNTLTSLILELKPGVRVGAHKHDAFVFAYVLEGRVRSQLDDGEIIEYSKGQTWIEPANVVHRLTENPSESDIARILVVLIAKEDAILSAPVTD